MNNKPHLFRESLVEKLPLLAGCLCLASFGFTSVAQADDFTWTGGGSNDAFSDGDNWGGSVPTSENTTALIFDGSARLTPNVDGADPFVLNSLAFAAGAEAFTISGNAIQLDAASAQILQSSAANQVINSALWLQNNNAAINGTGAGSLTLAEVRNFTTGRVLTVNRSATISSLTADGTASLANLVLGGAADVTLTLGATNAGSGGYGTLTANGAANAVLNRINVNTSGTLGFSGMVTDAVTFGGTGNAVWAVGAAGWSINGNAAKALTFVDAGTKQFETPIFLSNNLTNSRQLTVSVSGGNVTFDGQIRDSSAGSGSGANGLVKTGTGTLILANADENSDYTGAVNVNQGLLVVGANNALGTAAGSTTVASGATLGFQGDIDYSTTESVSVAGTGVGGAGAIRNISGSNSFSGAIALSAATTLGADAGSLVLNGAITGGQNVTKVGSGTVALANASNALGSVTISAGTLESRAQGALGSATPTIGANGTVLFSTVDQTLTYGNTTFAGSTAKIAVAAGRLAVLTNSSLNSAVGFTKEGAGILEMDGSRAFYGGGTGANQRVSVNEGTLVANRSGGALIAGTSAGDATALVIGDGIHTATFQNKAAASFQISQFSAVTINAEGTLDTNGVTGSLNSITMNGGAISTGAGILTLSGGATSFSYTGNAAATVSGNVRLLAGGTTGFSVANGAAEKDVSISATIDNITSPVTLQKSGAGVLELTGSNTYTGSTVVNAGTLLVNNLNGSATGATTVTVDEGATLAGSGRITGAVSISGIVSPGNSLGTLTVANDLTWNANNSWVFELGTAALTLSDANAGISSQDMLNLTGLDSDFLKGTGSGWSFDFQGTGENGWYKIVDWTGTSDFIASDFTALNLAGGLSADFVVDHTTSALYVTVVPEPGTSVLLIAGVFFLAARSSRRATRN